MSGHHEVQAHLNAADRNPAKREQHLIAATQHAELSGHIPHFGRWSVQQITRREEQKRLEVEERKLKDGPARAQALREETAKPAPLRLPPAE
ncbi:MAG TPA: hypothetical protein VHY36_11145 [Steroidobacteraceae bacterium]|jgi:hypothetical protein|nr:hypothetical protein [Steroidobacteraceae bacterium]